MYAPRSPALRRKIAFVAKKDEFIRRWTKMGFRTSKPDPYANPKTDEAVEKLKRGDCTGAAELLKAAEHGSYPADGGDYIDDDMEPDSDQQLVKQMKRALKRVCAKRNVKR